MKGAEDSESWTLLQEQLGTLFREVLHLEQVGLRDDFFSLGGHSLLATQLVTRVRARLGLELSLRAFFEASTIERLAEHLDAILRGSSRAAMPPLRPVAREDVMPLSFAQQRLWFLDQLQPGQAAYNVPVALRLSGPLDVEALRATFTRLVERHEVLRTTFVVRDGQPWQHIHPAPGSWPLPVEDIRALPESHLRDRIAEESHHPFDLSTGPLLRTRLLRVAESEHVLLLCMHHIVSDGWSMGVLVTEVAAHYEALTRHTAAALPALPLQYADFASWQREWARSEALQSQVQILRTRLQGVPVLELPTDFRRPATRSLRGASRFFLIPEERVVALERMGRAEGSTLFMVLLAAFQALLARYSGQRDFCVGSPIAQRSRPELEPLIGFFVNTVVLRADLNGDPSFTELIRRVRAEALTAYTHQDVPFDRLVEALGGERDSERGSLFQVMFALQNAPMAPPSLPGVRVDILPNAPDTARFDLGLSLMARGGALEGALEYSQDLFTPATAERFASHFLHLLEAVTRDAGERISALAVMGSAERKQVLEDWNATQADFPREATLPELFALQVRRAPSAVAVEFEDTSLTYAELDTRANQLAWHLLSLRLGPAPRIAVCMHRSLDLIVGLLGILKMGGSYVPLDPAQPSERLSFLLGDAGAAAVLTQEALASTLPVGSRPVVRLDAEAERIARSRGDAPPLEVWAESLAY
ncbi:AMP-binding protein, partial [Myxococcaceae bacterium JPH2]|nr:AMP-binding protein [Myxococcaceae bacterium JPH2]